MTAALATTGRLRRAHIQTVPHYAATLRSRLQPFFYRVRDPDFALLTDTEILEDVLQMPAIARAMQQLRILVAGAEVEVQPADANPASKRFVPYVKAFLDQIEDFDFARSYLTNAVLMGLAVMKKTKSRRVMKLGPDTIRRSWVMVDKLTPIDKRRLEIERLPVTPTAGGTGPVPGPQENGTVDSTGLPRWNAYWKLYDPERLTWWVLEDRRVTPLAELAQQDFVWHNHDPEEDRVGYGRGLLELLATLARLYTHAVQYRAANVEKASQAWLIAKVNTQIGAWSTDTNGLIQTASQRITDWLDLLQSMQGRYVAAVDARDDLQVVEMGKQSNDVIKSFMDDLERMAVELLLAATLGTQQGGEGKGGNFSQTRAHESSTTAWVGYLARRLAGTIRRDLVREWMLDNWSMLSVMGFADCQPPKVILRDERQLTPEGHGRMLQIADALGLTEEVSVDEALDGLYLKRRSAGEESVADVKARAITRGTLTGGGAGGIGGGMDPGMRRDGPDVGGARGAIG